MPIKTRYIPCYADELPLPIPKEHVNGCWECPHRDLCPDAMTDISKLCGMILEDVT